MFSAPASWAGRRACGIEACVQNSQNISPCTAVCSCVRACVCLAGSVVVVVVVDSRNLAGKRVCGGGGGGGRVAVSVCWEGWRRVHVRPCVWLARQHTTYTPPAPRALPPSAFRRVYQDLRWPRDAPRCLTFPAVWTTPPMWILSAVAMRPTSAPGHV